MILKTDKGQTGSFKGILVGAILVTLFVFLIITFATDTLNNYGKDTTELEQGAFNLTPYETYLEDVESDAQTFQDRFASGNIFSIIAGVVVTGIFNIGVDMIGLITIPFSLFAQIMTNVLGVPAIVTSVFLGIMILTIIFAIWRLIKIGE
jgi:hypothetical protein